jgi:hypothetical protein
MINLFKILFSPKAAKVNKANSIAAHIEFKETSANTWWS